MPFETPNHRPVNTLQQDLFMATKSARYNTHNIDRITSIKLVLSPHVANVEHLRTRDVLFWLLKEFYIPGVILPNREDILDLLINPASIHTHGPIKYSFDELVIYEILDRLSCKTVYKDGVWQLPFPEPQVDPGIQAILDAYAKYQDAERVKELPFSEEGREDLPDAQYETISFSEANFGNFLVHVARSPADQTWAESFYQFFKLDQLQRPANQRWAERLRLTRNATRAKVMTMNKVVY